jgi:hypothetical protein
MLHCFPERRDPPFDLGRCVSREGQSDQKALLAGGGPAIRGNRIPGRRNPDTRLSCGFDERCLLVSLNPLKDEGGKEAAGDGSWQRTGEMGIHGRIQCLHSRSVQVAKIAQIIVIPSRFNEIGDEGLGWQVGVDARIGDDTGQVLHIPIRYDHVAALGSGRDRFRKRAGQDRAPLRDVDAAIRLSVIAQGLIADVPYAVNAMFPANAFDRLAVLFRVVDAGRVLRMTVSYPADASGIRCDKASSAGTPRRKLIDCPSSMLVVVSPWVSL